MIAFQQVGQGIIVPCLVNPRARHSGLVGIHDGHLKVSVTSSPERGRANSAVVKLLAVQLGLKRTQVELVAGTTTRRKQIRFTGIDLPSLSQKIASRLDET